MSGSVQSKAKRGIVVAPYTSDLVDAVKAFNARLRAGGGADLSRKPTSRAGCRRSTVVKSITSTYLAMDEDAVRGGLHSQASAVLIGGRRRATIASIGCRCPKGRSTSSSRPSGCRSISMPSASRSCLHDRHRRLSRGGGQMLVSAGWKTWRGALLIFESFAPRRFLRNIVYLRTSPLRRLALDAHGPERPGLDRGTCLPGHEIAAAAARARGRIQRGERFRSLGRRDLGSGEIRLLADRRPRRDHLNILYPASEPRWIRLKVTFEGKVVGWAVVLNVPMHDHNYFGNMRVGSLIDCLALPGMEDKVVVAADPLFESAAAPKFS